MTIIVVIKSIQKKKHNIHWVIGWNKEIIFYFSGTACVLKIFSEWIEDFFWGYSLYKLNEKK